jgi:endonuclease/exonuclease/phosphatase family metal-dependent hydrolase
MREPKRAARGLLSLTVLGAASVLGAAPAQAAGDPDIVLRKARGEVEVLTLNQYLGASLEPFLIASVADFNAALLQALKQAADNDARARIQRQAEAIARRRPDLIGLQEVIHAECRELPPTPGACAEPSIAGAFVDHLDLTLRALREHGAVYQVAARVVNFVDLGNIALALPELGDLGSGGIALALPGLGSLDPDDIKVPLPGLGDVRGVPFTIGGKNALLVAYDQDVILSRDGVSTQPVPFACGGRQSAQGCNYSTSASVQVGGMPIEVKRGYVAVDAEVRGRAYRFVNTHLETQDMAIQAGQAAELLAALAGTPIPPDRSLILVGDLNSSPTDVPPAESPTTIPPYRQFVDAGFVDVWAARHGLAFGFTCCQDSDLRDELPTLDKRIDLIFTNAQPVLVKQARVVLDEPGDRTLPPPGQPRLWPSDHAGVGSVLNFWGRVQPGNM